MESADFRIISGILRFGSILSAIVFLAGISLIVISATSGSADRMSNFLQHKQYLELSGGGVINGTSCYTIRISKDSVDLFEIGLNKVVGGGVGPDGKPMTGLLDPEVDILIHLKMRYLLLITAIAAILPSIWIAKRFSKKQERGFPI